jgi:hypothetical protein
MGVVNELEGEGEGALLPITEPPIDGQRLESPEVPATVPTTRLQEQRGDAATRPTGRLSEQMRAIAAAARPTDLSEQIRQIVAATSSTGRLSEQMRAIAAAARPTDLSEQIRQIVAATRPTDPPSEQIRSIAAVIGASTPLHEQIRAVAASVAMNTQIQQTIAAQALSFQRATASQLHIQLAQRPTRVLTSEARGAWRVLAQRAGIHLEVPTVAGFRDFDRLFRDEEISDALITEAEAAIGADANLAAAVDLAAELIASGRPWLTNKRARQILMVWIWMCWTGLLIALALTTGPVAAAVGAAAGAVGSGPVSRVGADLVFPGRRDEWTPRHHRPTFHDALLAAWPQTCHSDGSGGSGAGADR